ncbi:mannosyltransferase [Coniothyrium glycines]
MLINMPHVITAIPRLIAVPLVLLTCSLFFLPGRYDGPPSFDTIKFYGKNVTEAGSVFSATVHDFWQDLASALLEAQPQCPPLKLDGEPIGSMADFRPVKKAHAKHPDRLVDFTSKDETALLQAHYRIRTSAQRLAPRLPFNKDTTGIVTTANARYMPIFLVSLRMLRRTGCRLPVEVFIDDWTKYEPTVCDTVLPSLNARCVVLSNIYNKAEGIQKPDHFQYKVLAILFSSFQHVLFLDSDAFPSHDPTPLFTTAPYTSHGLVTWPDYWALTTSLHFYHIASIPPELPQSRYSTESGQLLLNKHTHRASLLMMVYYNYYGPDYYYPLLSQGSHGAGDKETFVPAALAVSQPWYQVRTGASALGRVRNGAFKGIGLAQADPREDYTYLPPLRSHVHDDAQWQIADLAPLPSPPTITTTPAADANTTIPPSTPAPAVPRKPRPLFLHQNMLKLDPKTMLRDKSQTTFEADGTPHRMWGSEQDMVGMLGYDVEKVLWGVILTEACREHVEGETCTAMTQHIADVFEVV